MSFTMSSIDLYHQSVSLYLLLGLPKFPVCRTFWVLGVWHYNEMGHHSLRNGREVIKKYLMIAFRRAIWWASSGLTVKNLSLGELGVGELGLSH